MEYLRGFGNHFESEAVSGALPVGQNSPQRTPHGLYAEQLSGSAFTAARSQNLRTWLYRIRPSVVHSPFKQVDFSAMQSVAHGPFSPEQRRWDAEEIPKKLDFWRGVKTMVVSGGALLRKGCAVHVYACTQSSEVYWVNADGEFVFIPETGSIVLHTELGSLAIEPNEIGVVPRGMKFWVEIAGASRGYIGENFGAPFRLPDLGLIGSNGLANPRDFRSPVARFEDKRGTFSLIHKFQGGFWKTELEHSPLDVVAWHGNYVPYKYDLRSFNTINTVSYDHPDPSIFTVLTSPSEFAGVANADFVIFPPRWMVADHSFRPPYYHRNTMSEFMGLIEGVYDAKPEGFVPGGASLHNCMSAHGPDAETFERAIDQDLKPTRLDNTMAFMFESSLPFAPTESALASKTLQKNYLDCWSGLKPHWRQDV